MAILIEVLPSKDSLFLNRQFQRPCDLSLGLVVGIPLLLVLNQKELRPLRILGLYSIEKAAIVLRFEYKVVRLHGDIDGGFTFLGQFDFKSTVPQPCDSSLGLVEGVPLPLVLNQKSCGSCDLLVVLNNNENPSRGSCGFPVYILLRPLE